MPGHYELEPSADDTRLVVTVEYPGLESFEFTIRASSLVDDPDEAAAQIERIVTHEVRQRDTRPASEVLSSLSAEGGVSRGPRGRGDGASDRGDGQRE